MKVPGIRQIILTAVVVSALAAAGCRASTPSGSASQEPTATRGVQTSAEASPAATSSVSVSGRPRATTSWPPRPTAQDTQNGAAPRFDGESPRPADSSPAAVRHKEVMRGHGVIKSIDPDQRGLSIEHEANAQLGLGPGVTHYTVTDPHVLEDANVGDEVDYDVERDAKGRLVLSDVVQMGR